MSKATLILGGARSGKSRRALELAEDAGLHPVFIATAQALDDEMEARIGHHRDERSGKWTTLEAPLDLMPALAQAEAQGDVCLVDCLTLWLSNLMHHDRAVEEETAQLRQTISTLLIPIVLVSNEVGLGLVPETALGRAFRDAQGRLNQHIAAACDRVEFVAAGLPITLKS